jgi:hypothetical protein
VQIFKAVTVAVFISAILGTIDAEQAQVDILSEYYGFEEIEIIKLDWGIQDLSIADFNGDGRNDIVIVNNGKAKIELLIQKDSVGPGETEAVVDPNDIDVNTITHPTRFEKQGIAVSQKVYSLVCGDLNSDGMKDLAFYGEPKGLYVMLQKANGAEADKPKSRPGLKLSWQTIKKFEIDDGLLTSNMLDCADLNNDGANDLALAGRDGIYIVVQKAPSLPRSGNAGLAEPVKYPTSAQTLSLKVGDLNGDKINDLILITNDIEKPVHVRFGLESGQLGPQERFFIERPFTFKLHNIDGVAGEEILTVDSGSGRLICYKFAPLGVLWTAVNQKSTGCLAADADWPILFYPLASGEGDTKRDLVIGDFDGNGLVDVIISDPGAAEIIFYKQMPGLGLAEPVRFPAFADITSLSAVDIDKDGKTELGVLSVKEKVIGLTKFEDDRLSFPQPVDLTGEPVAMELADVDNDGNVDCIYISIDSNNVRTLRTIYNLSAAEKRRTDLAKGRDKTSKIDEKAGEPSPSDEGPGKTGPALELKKLTPLEVPTDNKADASGLLLLTGLTSNPDGLKVLDVDQDGLQDVLIFVSYEPPILVRQIEKRKFEVVDSPKAQASLIKDASLPSIALANVDDKAGKELLVAQKNFARSLVFLNGWSWNVIDQYNAKSTENQISAVAAFDIYGEGLESRPAILLLDGRKGQLQILKTGDDKTYRVEKELDVGKWNAAAHLKMLFAPLTGNESRPSKTGRDEAKSLLLFDSGKFALITRPNGGNAAGHLEQSFNYETKINEGIYGNLTAGDINHDGRTDIIMVEGRRNHIEILALDAGLKPIPAMRFKIFEQKSYRDSKGVPKPNVEPRELQVADVTNDGKDDLIIVIHDRIIIYPQD